MKFKFITVMMIFMLAMSVHAGSQFFGTTTFENMTLSTGNDICIDGGNCLSNLTGGGESLWVNSSGYATYDSRVGIGTTSPSGKIDITGNGESTAMYVRNNGTGAGIDVRTANSSNIGLAWFQDTTPMTYMYSSTPNYGKFAVYGNGLQRFLFDSDGNSFLNGGNVGIGTSNPGYKLEVDGTGTSTALGVTNDNGNGIDIKTDGTFNSGLLWYQNGTQMINLYETTLKDSIFGMSSQGVQKIVLKANGNTYFDGGNVGIGTSNPSAKLDVVGNVEVNGNLTADNLYTSLDCSNITGSASNLCTLTDTDTDTTYTSGNGLSLVLSEFSLNTTYSDGRYYQPSTDSYLANSGDTATGNYTFDTNTLHVDSTNNKIGIGTTTPQNKLDVEGAVAIGTTYSGTNSAPTNGMIVEGNVGIGTVSPFNDTPLGSTYNGLDIHGSSLNNFTGLRVINDNTTTVTSQTAEIYLDPRGGSGRRKVRLVAGKEDVYTSESTADSYFTIFTAGNDVWNQGLYQNAQGNIGIGTTSPGEKLEVAGNIQVDNNITVGGASGGLIWFNGSHTIIE